LVGTAGDGHRVISFDGDSALCNGNFQKLSSGGSINFDLAGATKSNNNDIFQKNFSDSNTAE
jgi:hypothetical protein